tara:strand:- start:5559 stop:5807 length:249 start_codon:yes stop_codon:yes gene_type:complete
VGDQQSVPVAARDAERTLKLIFHCNGCAHVVEKHVALHDGHVPLVRYFHRHGFMCGSAVYEKQPARVQLGHEPVHGLGVLSK